MAKCADCAVAVPFLTNLCADCVVLREQGNKREPVMSRDEEEAIEQDTEALKGIRGWLLFYLIGPIILGFTIAVASTIAIDAEPFVLFFSIAGLVSVWSIFQIGQPWVRGYHIFINAVLVILGVLSGGSGAIGSGVWVWYWSVSKRVKNTYGVARDAAVASAD